MSRDACWNTECTYAQTGICLLNKDPEECSYRAVVDEKANDGDGGEYVDSESADSQDDETRFPPSNALGMHDVRNFMGNERCRIIGLLGVPDSGKTACLVSLYLLLSHDRVPEYSFADSRSLVALDELSRGARRWQGGPPEQMTVHTERGDDRFPGFVHFKLRRKGDGTSVNLIIPDLPGEWTNSLIDRNRTDRLSFLPSADGIWVMVNGRMLVDKEQRLGTIHRTNLIIDRIAELCDPDIPSLRLVVSRADLGEPDASSLQQLQDNAGRHGIALPVSLISSFSMSPEVRPGTGIAELVAATVETGNPDVEFWPEGSSGSFGTRNSLRFRTGGMP